MLTVGSLFSGIGGIDLGLERAGMRVAWQCEADPWCRAVLRAHWPDIACYEDIRGLVPPAVDVLAGGFPCQPVSVAGRRQGNADARWLWPEFNRLIRVLRPGYVLVENVPGLLARGMGEVLGDLAEGGYDAEWDCIPAAAFGAPHLRYRVLIVAYPNGSQLRDEPRRLGREGFEGLVTEREGTSEPGHNGEEGLVADSEGVSRQLRQAATERPRRPTSGRVAHANCFAAERSPVTWAERNPWPPEPEVGRVVDGFSGRVDELRGLGNAVVPTLAQWIGEQIMTAHLGILDRIAEASA